MVLWSGALLVQHCVSNAVVLLGGKPRRDWLLTGSWLLRLPTPIESYLGHPYPKQTVKPSRPTSKCSSQSAVSALSSLVVCSVKMGDSADLLTEIHVWPCTEGSRKEFGTLPGTELGLQNNSTAAAPSLGGVAHIFSHCCVRLRSCRFPYFHHHIIHAPGPRLETTP